MDWSKGEALAIPAAAQNAEAHRLRGLYERWRDGQGGEIDTVAILTCPSNATVSVLHDRMPVVLAPEDFASWLDVKGTDLAAAAQLLRPAPEDLFEPIELNPKINELKATSQAFRSRSRRSCFSRVRPRR